jgi:hypothetical protein
MDGIHGICIFYAANVTEAQAGNGRRIGENDWIGNQVRPPGELNSYGLAVRFVLAVS